MGGREKHRGTLILEVILALAIVSLATLALSNALTMSRRVASTAIDRAVQLETRVRVVSDLCRCDVAHGQPGRTPVRSRDDGRGASIESSTIRHAGETLVVVRLPSEEHWWVACGLPGTKRWLP
jgi:hypothetical protein